jgi:peptidoglycan/xylan/chitin deacetylase (PgdA/CDA1 family)
MDRIGPVRSTADGHPVVYLTFDDGPSLTHTARILAVLRRHHARATFFVEGRFAHRYPQLIAAELAAGDSIGSHTWSHPHLPTLSAAAIRKELLSTQRYLRSLGVPAQCFRPPFGETNAVVHRVEAAMGIHEYLWTTETKYWTHASSARDLQRADAGLRPGAIIVFHDGHGSGSNQTVAAVDQFLTRAQAQGYIALPLPC